MVDAYVITLDTPKHIKMADRVVESCREHGINSFKWKAFNGLGDVIKIPEQLVNQTHISLLKVKNFNLTLPEIACFYSHYSLWCHCVNIDKPIIILEHDVRFVKKYNKHTYYNAIVYLGHLDENIDPDVAIVNYDYKFIRGAYAYSIDPAVAKNLVSHVIKEGLCRPVDVTMRSDYFTVIKDNNYAVHVGTESTMPNRVLYQEPTKD